LYNNNRTNQKKSFCLEEKMGVLADNERLVMEMHKDGKNKSEIANKFGCTVGAVTVFLYNRGVKKQKTSYGLLEQNREKIIQWLDSGYSAYKIAKELGCAKSSVLCFIKKNNLSNKNVCKVDYDNLLKDKENEVVELYNSGLSCDEVGDITGHSGSQVSVLLKKSDQEVRDWKYSVDENFFDWIDSEEKAYILGWFFSDGCVYKYKKKTNIYYMR
jgi:DNA-binding CsgD family transcriptional regulator